MSVSGPDTGAGPSLDEVVKIVREVVTSLDGDLSPASLKLQSELTELSAYITDAKRELAAMRTDTIRDSDIPLATDELDAVVSHTEEATGVILDAAEEIETIAAAMEGEEAVKITDAVTRIYEASNFQDITGQRVNKVVATLKHIAEKVEALSGKFASMGDTGAAAPSPKAKPAAGHETPSKGGAKDAAFDPHNEKEDLLNGPQLPDNAVTQDDIDALFANPSKA